MQKHLRDALVPPDQIATDLSGGISMIIEMMMAKDPRERYASAEDLIEDLEKVAAGESPVHARPKLDAPLAAIDSLGGAGEAVVASAPQAQSPWSTTMGIVVLAVLGVSVAANAVLLLLVLMRR
jgi:hypothetical protein